MRERTAKRKLLLRSMRGEHGGKIVLRVGKLFRVEVGNGLHLRLLHLKHVELLNIA